jgi:beta-1,4-mannosyl-glycoprotein beta-1,4-N-acetylglucosaminyltransferase
MIYGDVDEIPSLPALERALEHLEDGASIVHLAQNQYYFYLNVEEVSNTLMSYTGEYPFVINRKWLGSNISKWEYSKNYSMTELRDPIHKRVGKRVKNGGWHFTYLGGDDFAKNKIQSFAHSDDNRPEILAQINVEESIRQGRGIKLDNADYQFKPVKVDDYLPATVVNNPDTYADRLLPADVSAREYLPK